MRECKRHPSESQPGGGVCASCLEERLSWLWRGESFRNDNPQKVPTSHELCKVDSREPPLAPPPPPPPPPPSSVLRKQLQVLGVASRAGVNPNGADVNPNTTSQNSKAVIEEWSAFQAKRRGNLHQELEEDYSDDSPKAKSLDSMESSTKTTGEAGNHPNPELQILMNAQKMRSQSMPLDIRSAEETALRVINEQDDLNYFEDVEIFGANSDHITGGASELQGCFSPVSSRLLQSRKSPKWVKVLLATPMTSRNRVFPKETDQTVRKKSRYGSRSKRAARFDSSDWGFKEGGNGGTSTEQRKNTRSVFSWLQDAETTQYKKCNQTEQLTSSSLSSLTNSVSTDSWLRDLTTVGHLHEIAEELEIVEESSEEELEDLEDVSSFGKFLLLAAQRHPNARLTRLVSAPSH